MEDPGPAVHKTIVAVDVQGFGDRRRTNRNQLVIREGLYRAMQDAFARAGIPWVRGTGDRGDGILILVGPEVPKSLFVESLPSALVTALCGHNDTHPDLERIRLRMALHAGEVNLDPHGATGTSINETFRLLEASELKEALAGSTAVLAIITSSWFFTDVVRNSTADAGAYREVKVTVKETSTTGWIYLPDQKHRPARQRTSDLPVTVPLGRLPVEVRGRDELLGELCRATGKKRRRRGGTWVLAGMGGLGKSTVALAAAQRAQQRGWRVWWVTAADATSLTGGMLEILHQLGAPESVTRPVSEGSPLAAERAWEFLNAGHLRGRWLLILDNADSPAVLAAPGAMNSPAAENNPADYTGWLRPDPSGVVIVTTRSKSSRIWGHGVNLRELRPLDDATAARVLADLAPGVPDPDHREARELAHRLGGLPLALHLAGTYLTSPFARWRSFAEYRRALDSAVLPDALADLDDPGRQARDTIGRTWDLSLNALAADDRPQARPLLSLLSCYAPATVIPGEVLDADLLAGLFASAGTEVSGRQLRAGLHGLATVGLIDTVAADKPGLIVHPVVADASRARLLTTAQADLPVIGRSAVRLLDNVTAGLDEQRPADWTTWRLVTPHVSAVLDWLVAWLDATTLESLLATGDRTTRALLNAGNFAMAEKLAVSGVAAAARLGDDHPASLTARHTLGRTMAKQGRNGEAEQMYRQVLAVQQRVLGEDHLETLKSRSHLAWMVEYQGRYAEAEEMYHQLLADARRILGEHSSLTLIARRHVAWATAIRGNYADAEKMYRQLLADQMRVLGDEHPDTLIVGQGLAWTISLQGRLAEAERQFRQVLTRQRRIMGDDHPDTIDTRYRLTRVVTDQGRYHEAERAYREILADRRRVQGDDHPATMTTRDNLARVTGLQGRHLEAEQLFLKLLADRCQKIGQDHPHTLTTRHRLACVIADQGRPGEAEKMFRDVLADRERVMGPRHPNALATRHRLAQAIAAQGRHAEAEQLFRQVHADRELVLGPSHPDTITTRNELARLEHPA